MGDGNQLYIAFFCPYVRAVSLVQPSRIPSSEAPSWLTSAPAVQVAHKVAVPQADVQVARHGALLCRHVVDPLQTRRIEADGLALLVLGLGAEIHKPHRPGQVNARGHDAFDGGYTIDIGNSK